MMEALRSLGVDCIVVFGGLVAVIALLRFAGAVLDALPMSRARRGAVSRVRPLLGATVIAIYAVVASRWVLASADSREAVAYLLIVAVAIAASWMPLRDAVEGIYLRLGASLVAGDRLDVDGVRGRIKRLGARAIVVETSDGELAVIPYRRVASSTFRRAPADDRSAFHVFRVAIPATRTIPELKRAVHEAALLCHWSSTRRAPIVNATDDGQLEITVFPVDANHVTEIERVVRRALG